MRLFITHNNLENQGLSITISCAAGLYSIAEKLLFLIAKQF